jgi:hypothetical protein
LTRQEPYAGEQSKYDRRKNQPGGLRLHVTAHFEATGAGRGKRRGDPFASNGQSTAARATAAFTN